MSSALLGIESVRACGRYGPEYAALARSWLDGVALLPLDDAILDAATALGPQTLRSLDALHLATAVGIGEDIGVFVTYDESLIVAARDHGLEAVAPG